MLGLPVLTTPWSENETQLMNQLFPSVDSLCLNFGRTGVFQWNGADSSVLWATSEWPQRIAGDLPRRLNQGGIESTKIDPRPRMPYVAFRHMGPHFDSYANSGIPEITGTAHQPFSGRSEEKRPDLLHLLPHLCPNDVGSNALTRIRDLQQLATAIQESTGRRPASHPNHSTTYRLSQLNAKLLQQERQLIGNRAKNIIHILCKTDLADTLLDRGYTPSAKDYLGYLAETPVFTGEDKWGALRRMESGWGDWFVVIGQVCKAWHAVTQKRRSNPSHITFRDVWENEGRAYREIQSSYNTYKKLHSVYVGNRVLQNKTQAHDLVNILYDRVPTLKKLHLPNATAGIGLRAAKTLAMRGLCCRALRGFFVGSPRP